MEEGSRTALFFHLADFADGVAVHIYNLHNKTPFLLLKLKASFYQYIDLFHEILRKRVPTERKRTFP